VLFSNLFCSRSRCGLSTCFDQIERRFRLSVWVLNTQTYHPGQEVSVVIYPQGQHASKTFRGFFLQARDANSNEWIGEWVQSDNTKTIPECSAITHSDNRDKLGAKLVWKAPQNKRGNVYFT